MKGEKVWNKRTGAKVLSASMMAAMLLSAAPVYAEESTAGIDLSTPYPGIMVKAGETVNFDLDFTSLDGTGQDVALSIESLPEDWSGYFKSSSSEISKVHVPASAGINAEVQEGLADFSLSVPAETAEGVYTVELKADAGKGLTDVLEIEVNVSEEEGGESNFSSEYPEQQGASGSSFSFETTIVNNRGTNQTYSLAAEVADGWQVTFTPSGESTNVTSIAVDAGSSQGMTVKVTPPTTVEKGDYSIPCTAISANDTLKTELSVEITGTYSVSLSTTDGRLSCDAYANKKTSVTLSVTNNGNVDLTNLNLTSSAPTDWEVEFSESTIDTLEAGATKEVTATIKPTDDAITGDYVTSISISNSETSSSAEFRVSVKTSTTWGFAAIGIIIVLVCGLGVIFKKYGRR